MSEIPEFSPGCFGSALAYKDDEIVCRACTFRTACLPVHLENRLALQLRMGLKPKAAAKPAVEAKSSDPARLSLPVKVVDLLNRLDNGNFDIIGKMKRGENPLASGFPFMKIVCHLLMRYPGALNRQMLSSAFVSKLKWQENTAEAHARMAIQVLTHIGAVDNVDGNITLRRHQ